MTKILVVDDSPLDLHYARRCAEAAGAEVVGAKDGLHAMRLIGTALPDAVLTDLQMPDMDGLELVRQMKDHHPSIPVILMTAHGSEEVAVEALKAGAAYYVPKKNLRRDLEWALDHVMAAAEAAKQREQIRSFLKRCENEYVIGYEPNAPRAVISHLQDSLLQMDLCDEVGQLQVATALTEAITNAIDHGNLELKSGLRERDGVAYRKLGEQRAKEPPYRDRRVYVTARFDENAAVYVVRDEGAGFDPNTLPDPTVPENLLKPSGRGVLLIRTFMDEVHFNDKGNEITMIKRGRQEDVAS